MGQGPQARTAVPAKAPDGRPDLVQRRFRAETARATMCTNALPMEALSTILDFKRRLTKLATSMGGRAGEEECSGGNECAGAGGNDGAANYATESPAYANLAIWCCHT